MLMAELIVAVEQPIRVPYVISEIDGTTKLTGDDLGMSGKSSIVEMKIRTQFLLPINSKATSWKMTVVKHSICSLVKILRMCMRALLHARHVQRFPDVQVHPLLQRLTDFRLLR